MQLCERIKQSLLCQGLNTPAEDIECSKALSQCKKHPSVLSNPRCASSWPQTEQPTFTTFAFENTRTQQMRILKGVRQTSNHRSACCLIGGTCSLQSQASERLQSSEKLIHEQLHVLTADQPAGDAPLNVNHSSKRRSNDNNNECTGTHALVRPTGAECLHEDLCPA